MRCRCASPTKRRPALFGLTLRGIRELWSCGQLTLCTASVNLPPLELESLIRIEDGLVLLRWRRMHSILDNFSPCWLHSSIIFDKFERGSACPSLHLLLILQFPRVMSFAAPTWPSIFWARLVPSSLPHWWGILCWFFVVQSSRHRVWRCCPCLILLTVFEVSARIIQLKRPPVLPVDS